jgi:hypothetical protein
MLQRYFSRGFILLLTLFLVLAGVRLQAADLPPRPDFDANTIAPKADDGAGFVTVVVESDPLEYTAPESTIAVVFTITNQGDGEVSDAELRQSLDPGLVRLLEVSFSRENVWVSSASPEKLKIRTGPLARNGDSVQVFMRLQVLPDAPNGAQLIQQATIVWDNRNGGYRQGYSNQLPLVVFDLELPPSGFVRAEQGAAEPIYVLLVSQDSTHVHITGDTFLPGEPVALWINLPNGDAEAIDRIIADSGGAIHYTFDPSGLPPGTYSIVAAGVWSRLQALGPFQR